VLFGVGRLDDFREQLAERAEIRSGDREHAGKRAKADHFNPDQRPDQRVDPAHGVKAIDSMAEPFSRRA
jgi:hypothetical protein